MKRCFAIGMVIVFTLHFVGWFGYFGVRLTAIRAEMKRQLQQTSTEELEKIILTPTEYQTALHEEDEMQWRGKMYDIAKVEPNDGHYVVHALHDQSEDNLLSLLNEALKRSASDKKPVPSQLISFIQSIGLPVQWTFSNTCSLDKICDSPYINLYSSFRSTIDSPPPRG